jgi:hypothetical protein
LKGLDRPERGAIELVFGEFAGAHGSSPVGA